MRLDPDIQGDLSGPLPSDNCCNQALALIDRAYPESRVLSAMAMLQQQPAEIRFRIADHWPRKVWLTRTYLVLFRAEEVGW